jgi:[acyl-carrier-protein] S-malonyltransferase
VGAGKALTGMIRRIHKDMVTANVATPDDVVAAVAAMKG